MAAMLDNALVAAPPSLPPQGGTTSDARAYTAGKQELDFVLTKQKLQPSPAANHVETPKG